MYREVEWLTPSDRPILSEVKDYGGWIKPASLGLNLPYTRQHISVRCGVLAEHDLLERHPDVAAYRLTELGERFLADELEPEDLTES